MVTYVNHFYYNIVIMYDKYNDMIIQMQFCMLHATDHHIHVHDMPDPHNKIIYYIMQQQTTLESSTVPQTNMTRRFHN